MRIAHYQAKCRTCGWSDEMFYARYTAGEYVCPKCEGTLRILPLFESSTIRRNETGFVCGTCEAPINECVCGALNEEPVSGGYANV